VALFAGLLLCLDLGKASAQLQTAADELPAGNQRKTTELNISIAVFDPGVPADASTHRRLRVFPRIRNIEALYLPFVLRETLVNAFEWGAVRVVPEPDIAAEILLTGAIAWSDGARLELQIQAVDASGREWFSKSYRGTASPEGALDDAKSGTLGYQLLYDEVAADLKAARDLIDDHSLGEITNTSLLRYAVQLAPTAFAGYLNSNPDGTFEVNRLPAEDDPMLERIEKIRGVEYLITDAVDTKFKELHSEIASTYELWREYRRKFTQYQLDETERLQNVKSDAPKGSFEAIKASYDNYKWSRIAEQEQESWAVAFNNEVGPTVTQMESRVAELEGWVDQQYGEWSALLAELFDLETGLAE
jgi:hypothetical protein